MNKWCILVVIFALSFGAIYLTMPKHEFKYNPDVGISPYGMAIAKTYPDLAENAPIWYRGYVLNGEMTVYANWPLMTFKVLAKWFELTGRNDIFIARLWYALLYALNALLFFLFLKRLRINTVIAFCSSLSFIFLPSHLDFGALIYADPWFNTFWLLALIALSKRGTLNHILFYLIILSGFVLFHWFIVFLLPLPTLLHLLKRYKPGIKKILFIFLGVSLLVWSTQYWLFSMYSENYFIQRFSGYSIFGLHTVPGTYPLALLKRFVSLGYEAAVLLPLLLIAGWSLAKLKQKQDLDYLHSLLISILLCLSLYVVCFVNWFGYHRHGLGMFSILIAGGVAFLLSHIKQEFNSKFKIAASLALLIPIIMFLGLPLVSKTAKDVKQQDAQIAALINSKRTSQGQKVCLFFDEPGIGGTEVIRFDFSEFAIREYTNAYTFNLYEMERQRSITEGLKHGISKLKQNGIIDFDPSMIFMVSQEHYDFKDGVIVDSTSINKLNIYHLDLTNF